ncbi:putative gustatory receptor 28b [Ctenocephalides felis]|uniref:putative gustatory receptor 28b n=1 Tax=Ctenocephalides felis TaxID=7515 RepID=UPI000E6E47EC|nr:putative gustatory receptor 28b [Ctenocephalides felis]
MTCKFDVRKVSLVLDKKIEEQLQAIRLSCQLHTKLCKISRQLNSAYNIQIILYVALTFVVVVTQLYYVALGFMDPVNEYRSTSEIIMSVNWANYHLIGVIALAVSCHRASKEAARTGVLLHRMRNRHQSRVKEVIEMWSLQLLHQKLGYTAGGLFSIDMTLVYSIIGSMTTYLVILIQFNMLGAQRKTPLFSSPDNQTALSITS